MSPLTVPITILPSFGAPVSISSGRKDEHARLHRIGAHQHFGNEQDAVAEILADDSHALNQRLGEEVVGRPAAAEKDVGAFLDLFLEPVIQVVMHLLHKFIIGEFGKNDFIVRHR